MEPHGSALVTGASRGIGRAVASELAARGFSVIAAVRNVSTAAFGADAGRVTVARLDVTDPAPLDLPDDLRVVVNNAGYQDDYYPVETLPLDRLRAMLETNLIGPVAVLQQAIPVLRARGEGVICNITSSSVLLASPFFSAYRASKAAFSAVGETLAVELRPFGIRIVEILPGPVDTEGLARAAYVHAVEVPAYRGAAERMMAGRARATAAMVAPEAAAVRIVDTILDDHAPLRSSCDPTGDALLERWRHTPDQVLLDEATARYTVG